MISFVLGNGKSRLAIDPVELKPHGKVYACNAAYRDFTPDHLVAVDKKMVDELIENHVDNHTNVWTKDKHTKGNIKPLPKHLGWSSGPTALWLASQENPSTIYIIGFDYTPSIQYNNVYANTPNYKKSTDMAIFSGNWKRQTLECMKEHNQISYIRIVDEFHYDMLGEQINYSEMSMEAFLKSFSFKNSGF